MAGFCPDFDLFNIFVSDLLENTENHGIMAANVTEKISAHQVSHIPQPTFPSLPASWVGVTWLILANGL